MTEALARRWGGRGSQGSMSAQSQGRGVAQGAFGRVKAARVSGREDNNSS